MLFHLIVAPDANPVPFTVSVNAALPAVMLLGLSDASAGPATIVSVSAFEITPPRCTVICADPTFAIRFAGTDAVTSSEPTTFVVRLVLFQNTVAPDANPLPSTVNVNAAPPAVTVAGEMELIVAAAVIVNVTAFEFKLFDATLICAVPGLAMRSESTGACNSVELTKLVASAAPFHNTSAPELNTAPFTVNVNPLLPAVMLVGEIDELDGVTVKFTEFDVTPLAATVTGAVPDAVSKFAGTLAVSFVALTNVVATDVPLNCTTASLSNPLPLTVSVNAAPAGALVGLKLEITGGSGAMVPE